MRVSCIPRWYPRGRATSLSARADPCRAGHFREDAVAYGVVVEVRPTLDDRCTRAVVPIHGEDDTPERWRVVEVRESTVGTGVPEVVLEPVD
jgi:hypothetical protein